MFICSQFVGWTKTHAQKNIRKSSVKASKIISIIIYIRNTLAKFNSISMSETALRLTEFQQLPFLSLFLFIFFFLSLSLSFSVYLSPSLFLCLTTWITLGATELNNITHFYVHIYNKWIVAFIICVLNIQYIFIDKMLRRLGLLFFNDLFIFIYDFCFCLQALVSHVYLPQKTFASHSNLQIQTDLQTHKEHISNTRLAITLSWVFDTSLRCISGVKRVIHVFTTTNRSGSH